MKEETDERYLGHPELFEEKEFNLSNKIKNLKTACTQRDRIIQGLDEKIESLKIEISELKNERHKLKQDIKRVEKNKLTEEEVKIVYVEYPKLLKKLEEREKRLNKGKIGKLIRFIERNTSSEGYIKSIGLVRELKK